MSPGATRIIGDEWAGPIPAAWPVARARHLARIYAGGTPDRANEWYWSDGTVPWLASGEVNQVDITEPTTYISEEALANSSAKWVPRDAVIVALAGQGKTKGMTAYLRFRATCNQSLAALVAKGIVHPRFLFWWFSAHYSTLRNLVGGELRDGLNLDVLADVPCPVPPPGAQLAIATYLDRETKRIDALIAAKGRLVGLLVEAEQRLLIDQVGDWRTTDVWSLRQARTEVVTGPFGTQLNAGEYVDDGVPVINPTHITRSGEIAHDRRVSVTEDVADRLRRHRVAVGDILLGRKGDVGRSAIVGVEQAGWVCGSDAIAVRTNPVSLDARFLAILLQIDLYRQQLYARSTGAMVASVNEDTLLGFRVPRLSLARQGVLVNEMNRVMSNRRAAIDRISASQTLLEEHRQAVVSAAVTGQLDLPEAA